MMTYYHLSTVEGLNVILSSYSERTAGVCQPRIPEDCADEDQTLPRVCVAPSVWQCVLSIPRKGRLFIYRVSSRSVTDPVHGPGGGSDFKYTGEKWITDDDIQKCGGQIRMQYLGFVDYTDEVEWGIRGVVGRPVLVDAGSDSMFFNVHGEEWFLNKTQNGNR